MSTSTPKEKKKSNTSWYVIVGKLTKILKSVKAIKFTKVLLTASSMFISVFVYAFGMGWYVATGLVGLLLVHELGHVWALRKKGFKAAAPVFIPMVGAIIFAPINKMNRHEEAYIGVFGPIIGGAAAIALVLSIMFFGKSAPAIGVIAYLGVYLNLFNLVPVRPLDGGRVTQAIGPWFKWVGIGLIMLVTFLTRSPGLLLLWLICLIDFRFPRYVKPFLACLIYAVMVFLEVSGLGQHEPLFFSVFDIVFGFIFCLMFIGIDWRTDMYRESMSEQTDIRPHLSKREKIKWFISYVVLLIVLGSFYAVSVGYLPAGSHS